MRALCSDVLSEYRELASHVARFGAAEWRVRTDFHGWTSFDEIAHLYLFDELAVIAATDASEFRRGQAELEGRLTSGLQISEIARERYSGVSGPELASRWESTFAELVEHVEVLEPRARLPWFGPDMSARSFATARLMETWAHGQDIYDAVGIVRPPTPRLRHIAHLGVVTYQWSYTVRGLQPPAPAPAVELSGPGEEHWTWNAGSTSGVVRGPAQDFCLVVTQRRHSQDTSLELEGAVAVQWMRIAQCFAGPPADGPAPGARKPATRSRGA